MKPASGIYYTHNFVRMHSHESFLQGKRKMMDGFVRWCQKSNVGLSQRVSVSEVIEEDPTGLYDDFYVKMMEDD